jgi:hypothetical protein
MPDRFVFVACHRGARVKLLRLQREVQPEAFELIEAFGSPTPHKSYGLVQRVGTSTHYRFGGTKREPYALELRAVQRLTWPADAEVDLRTARERRDARRGIKNYTVAEENAILAEWQARQRAKRPVRETVKAGSDAHLARALRTGS